MSSRHLSQRLSRKAFTLTEVLVVVAIIGVLGGLANMMFEYAQYLVDTYPSTLESARARLNRKDPTYKAPGKTEKPRWVPDQYIVVFRDYVQDAKSLAEALARDIPMEIVHVYDSKFFKGCAIKAPATSVPLIEAVYSVEYVTQNEYAYATAQTTWYGILRIGGDESGTRAGDGVAYPNLPFHKRKLRPGLPRDIDRIGDRDTGNPLLGINVTVAILDTGIDPEHPDLNVVFGKAFGYSTFVDGNGHGTHVAGITGAKDNSRGVVGVAPGCRLWAIKVLSDSGSGTFADVIAGCDFVASKGPETVQVANMSLGGGYNKAVNQAVAGMVRAGITVCVAAGNSSEDVINLSPASTPAAITVAALADSDGLKGGKGPDTSAGKDDTFATFSCFGALVDVIAPGVDILSTWPLNSYNNISGTSMACPHVAGLCALALDPDGRRSHQIRNIKGINNSEHFTPAQVRQAILDNVQEYILGPDFRLYPLINARPF